MKNKELLEKTNMLKPVLRIGKNGLTESVIKELKNHLKKKKLIKVKLLKSFIQNKDRKKIAAELVAKTNSEIIQQVGFVVVLHKEK
ncbi:RNA-binding protein [Candidatus Woesearchaeota archaeon B3_Woes]|nr:MAG: RNA-binding protein [Candidatus Woesearchaeota archaeon B3_Woes]